jgi:hypothetical protein
MTTFDNIAEAAIRASRRKTVVLPEDAAARQKSADQRRLDAAARADAHEARAKSHRTQAEAAKKFLTQLSPHLATSFEKVAHAHKTGDAVAVGKAIAIQRPQGEAVDNSPQDTAVGHALDSLHRSLLSVHNANMDAASHHEHEAVKARTQEGVQNISTSTEGPQSFVLTGDTAAHSKDTPCTRTVDGTPIPGDKAGETPRTVQLEKKAMSRTAAAHSKTVGAKKDSTFAQKAKFFAGFAKQSASDYGPSRFAQHAHEAAAMAHDVAAEAESDAEEKAFHLEAKALHIAAAEAHKTESAA